MIYYVRHGQSIRNQIKQKQLLESKNLEQYDQGKKKSKNFDCELSENGINQCIKLSKEIKNYDFEIVLVSPLRRALMTCNLALQQLQNYNFPKIIVQPLLTQIINSATNFGTCLEDSMKQFPDYNYDKVKNNVYDWYVHLLKKQKRQNIIKLIKQKQIKNGKKVGKIVLNQLKQNKQHLQSSEDIKQRANLLQEKLKEYRTIYKGNILIIGHSRITKFLCNSQKEEIPNGKIMQYDIQKRKISHI